MSEQERQVAIAKVEAQRYRRWLSWLILAPALLCAGLAIFTPQINNMLARNEAEGVCAERTAAATDIGANPAFIVDSETTGPVITAENIIQLARIGDTVVENPAIAARRDYPASVAHPDGDYVIFTEYQPSSASRFYICGEDDALGAFTADETARDVLFSPDGNLFVVSEGRFGRMMVFDGETVNRSGTLNTGNEQQIGSLAFHPAEPLLFVTSDSEIVVFDTTDLSEVHRVDAGLSTPHEISFNVDGTALYVIESTTDVPHAAVWAIE